MRQPARPGEAFRSGLILFNGGHFFEAHEAIEALWRAEEGNLRDFYKGLIQAAAALHLMKQGRLQGAFRMFQSSTRYLKPYLPGAVGVNVEKLVCDLSLFFEKQRMSKVGETSDGSEVFAFPKIRMSGRA